MIRIEHYFILNNGILFSTYSNIKNNLEDCFYVKKSTNSKIYISEKKDNSWIRKDEYIDDYDLLMNFIIDNKANVVCIDGFDKLAISKFISDFSIIKDTNITLIKFKNDLEQAKYERHLMTKKNRMEKLCQKLKNTDEIQTIEDYMKTLNSVFNERKHISRKKMIRLKK